MVFKSKVSRPPKEPEQPASKPVLPTGDVGAPISGCGLIWSDLGPGGDGAGHSRACAPLSAPGALAWMVRTALGSKKGRAQGSIEFRLPPLASREDEMETSLACPPLPVPSKKIPFPRASPRGSLAGVRLCEILKILQAGAKFPRRGVQTALLR